MTDTTGNNISELEKETETERQTEYEQGTDTVDAEVYEPDDSEAAQAYELDAEELEDYAGSVELAAALSEPAAPKKDILRFTRKRGRVKKLVFLAVVLAIGGFGTYKYMNKKPIVPMVISTPLERRNISNNVSLTGTVESSEMVQVYSALGSTIDAINVKVGDRVEAGTPLAQLNTENLRLDLARQQADINQTLKLNELGIETSEKDYETALSDIKNKENAAVVRAEQSLSQSQRALNDARRDLDDHKDDLEYADTVLNDLERKLNRARDAKDSAEKELNSLNRDDPDYEEKYAAQNAVLEQKEAEYDQINREWKSADTEYGGDLSVYSKAYRQARLNYEQALTDRDIAKRDAERGLDDLQSSIDKTKISGDVTSQQLALKKTNKDIADSTIKAPISGTVTEIYAKEGAPGSGLLFVVEDTDNLVIKTRIKEYDVAAVKEGMGVTIKSDAIGEDEFKGEVNRIYPAAVKGADGETKTGGNAEFDTDVSLTSQNTGLRVGMSVRINIVTAKKDGVLAVPFDAVTTNAEEKNVVYVAKPMPAPAPDSKEFKMYTPGSMTISAVEVTTGMETDFYIEVKSQNLAEGDQIISDPAAVAEGMTVLVSDGSGAPAGVAGGAAMMAMAG